MNKRQKTRIIKSLIILLLILVSYYYKEYIYEKPIENIKQEEKIQNKEINELENTENKIYFIDVGEADCILVSSNNEYALVDAGNTIDGNKIVKYIKSLNINEFKYVFGTHAHEDHIGGMSNIIYNFNINKYYMPNVPSKYKSYNNVLKALNKKNLELSNPNNDDEYNLGESTIKILYNGENEEDINNSSLIIEIKYKNTSFLLTGDTTKEIENNILDKFEKINVLKVAHHGSKDSSSAQFLSKTHPDYAIISVGKDNDYHHPHQVTLDKLNRINSKIYRTDQLGTIIITSDGNNISINNEITNTNTGD